MHQLLPSFLGLSSSSAAVLPNHGWLVSAYWPITQGITENELPIIALGVAGTVHRGLDTHHCPSSNGRRHRLIDFHPAMMALVISASAYRERYVTQQDGSLIAICRTAQEATIGPAGLIFPGSERC